MRSVLVRVDQPGPSWDIPAIPPRQPFGIGRSASNAIAFPDELTISRGHAELVERDGCHELRQGRYATHGIFVNGHDVTLEPTLLAPGDELQLADVYLVYLRGDDLAPQIADLIETVVRFDPVTRLPLEPAPGARIRIARWAELEAAHPAIVAREVQREVRRHLGRALGGGHLTFVAPGCFGVLDAATARRFAGPVTVRTVGTIELVAEP